MGTDGIVLRPADADGRAYAESVLSAAALPTADLAEPNVAMYVATLAGDPVGVGGLELHGPVGLLRSVAVEPDRRGEGLGSEICQRLEARAAAAGVETLYLLTTSARAFFADRGYEAVERASVPAAIARTRQFADLCPASATCLRKALG